MSSHSNRERGAFLPNVTLYDGDCELCRCHYYVHITNHALFPDKLDCLWKLEAFSSDARATFREAKILLHASLTTRNTVVHGHAWSKDTHKDPYTSTLRADSKTSDTAISFLTSVARHAVQEGYNSPLQVQLILPLRDGYIVRSDFLTQRLFRSRFVARCQGFVAPQQEVRSAAHLRDPDFATLLKYSVGGLQISQGVDGVDQPLPELLEAELSQRLSIPWVLPTPFTRKSLALVGSRPPFVLEPYLRAARNIGISLTVFGADGSWLQERESADLVVSYVPLDTTADTEFPSRIITAIRNHGSKFDGITTFTDTMLVPVARAAETLGLPTSPAISFEKSVDKHATRVEFSSDLGHVFRVKGLLDLKRQLHHQIEECQYPLVVKPCRGWNSEGVTKVEDEQQLFATVASLEARSKDVDIVVETYINGPEIDANFILLAGDVLFYELNDGFPSTADDGGSFGAANFLETDMVHPSTLNAYESDMIRASLHSKLLAMGFRTGVFHVEGRVRNSASHYAVKDGVLDLYPKPSPPEAEPDVVLLEVNARPPGLPALIATTLTYGVDFAAIHMLCALGESEMVRALSQSFDFGSQYLGSGAQHWGDLIYIPAKGDGVYIGDDLCEELKKRRPDLVPNILHAYCFLQKGDYVPGSSSGLLVQAAYFIISSTVSRYDLLRVAQELRAAVRVPLDTASVSSQGPFAAVGAAILSKTKTLCDPGECSGTLAKAG